MAIKNPYLEKAKNHEKARILPGSLRKKGGTSGHASEAENWLKETDFAMLSRFPNDPEMKGCHIRSWCKRNDITVCALQDDMQEYDGVIVASSVYFR